MASVELRKGPSGAPVSDVAQFADEWRDLLGPAVQGRAVAALTTEVYRDTPFLADFMRHDQDDALNFTHQVNHDFNRGQAAFHVHAVPMAAGAGVVVLDGLYFWTTRGNPVAAVAGWHAFRAEFPIALGDQFHPLILDLGALIVPASSAASDLFLVWLRRPGASDPADTYQTNKVGGTPAANLAILSADVHYQVARFGTADQFGV